MIVSNRPVFSSDNARTTSRNDVAIQTGTQVITPATHVSYMMENSSLINANTSQRDNEIAHWTRNVNERVPPTPRPRRNIPQVDIITSNVVSNVVPPLPPRTHRIVSDSSHNNPFDTVCRHAIHNASATHVDPQSTNRTYIVQRTNNPPHTRHVHFDNNAAVH